MSRNMKKWYSAALFLAAMCVFLLLSTGTAYARTYTRSWDNNGNFEYTFDNETGTMTITGSGSLGECKTPTTDYDHDYDFNFRYADHRDSVKTIVIEPGITEIDKTGYGFSGVFDHCEGLESVVLPEGMLRIGQYTFSECKKLKSVKLPDSITEIGEEAFSYCESLEQIVIPSKVKVIEDGVFKYCTSLTSAKLPNTVTKIGDNAFDQCKSLASINIPSALTELGGSAFANSKITSVTIPAGMKTIPHGAFYACHELKTVSLPAGLTTIEDSAFDGCDILGNITIPSSVTSIGSSAFSGCKKLTSVRIPVGVTRIESDTFFACEALASVILSDKTTFIGDNAFEWCESLKEITVPKTVTQIEANAFPSNKIVISGYTGSAAEKYVAASHGNAVFKALDGGKGASGKSQNMKLTFVNKTLNVGKTVVLKVSGLQEKPAVKFFYGSADGRIIEVNPSKLTATITGKKAGVAEIYVRTAFTKNYTASNKLVTIKVLPKATQISKLSSPKKGTIKVTWKANKTTDWYQIQYSKDSKFKTGVKSGYIKKATTTSKTISKLKAGTYYVRIRAIDKTKRAYSAWSKAKPVKVK